ncbi:MAG: helix-turn-helix transcriptional regulator [Bacilli bacterium]|nr:helix-turn-helix transcriptional regulator [Bacilli bacterium]
MSSTMGQIIKDLRKKNGFTQEELAERLGVTYQAVSKWENGKNMPDITLIKEISNIFKVDIEELLTGKNKRKKKNKFIFWMLVGWLLVIGIILGIVFYNENNSFEFKTMKSSCEEFTLTGSAAYNNDKTSIYISNVDYCGQENNTVYQEIECTLYENYKNTKTKIGTCGKSNEEMTLDEFLDTVELNVNNYEASCKMFASSTLSLEIYATTNDNKKTTYQIPINLEENCQK